MHRIFAAADRMGFELKAQIVSELGRRGYDVEDLGPFEAVPVDYPKMARAVARRVIEDVASIGILVCSTGLGMTIAANRMSGIRAANCSTTYLAMMARSHNDANVLCLGSSITDIITAIQIVDMFINTPFDGGKHLARVRMLDDTAAGSGDERTVD